MAVYVDSMRVCVPNKNWKWKQCCHLFANTKKELHQFAKCLYLKRNWFQNKTLPHYDLTSGKRKLAIAKGAIAISDKKLVEMIRKHRRQNRGTVQKAPTKKV